MKDNSTSKRQNWQRIRASFRRYLGSIRWFHIPAAAGFAMVGYQQYRHITDRERRKLQTQTAEELVIPSWQVCHSLLYEYHWKGIVLLVKFLVQ